MQQALLEYRHHNRPQVFRMDPFDIRLTALLQQNCRMPLQELAEALDVSARTIAKRIAALEQDGGIKLIAVTDIHSAGNEYIVQVGVR